MNLAVPGNLETGSHWTDSTADFIHVVRWLVIAVIGCEIDVRFAADDDRFNPAADVSIWRIWEKMELGV
jgi:hypothetical protein